ncbi:MAG TPA: LacI family DNA-binding transcriptional regulator, partial [Arthrobacter sp.]
MRAGAAGPLAGARPVTRRTLLDRSCNLVRMDLAVTLKNVAAHAGVSRTTASNVLTGTGRVSSETRERVHQAM